MRKVAMFILVVLVAAASALAQPSTVKAVKKDPSRGSKCEKCVVPTTDIAAPKPDASRGQCCLDFDNWTPYILDVWVDGVYRGRVAAWDRDGLCVGSGWTTWYVETIGHTYYWEGEGECNGDYVLTIE
jgi:hypothetical protein